MAKKIDLTGQRFGRLVVIGRSEEKRSYWNCKCECGNEIIVRGDSLRSGHTKSCGCYKDEMASKKFKEKWKDEEYRQMQSELSSKKLKEKWQDDEYRQMKSNKLKEKWQDEEYRQKQRNGIKEKWQDEEYRQMQSDKMRKMAKEKWQDEEFRQMQSNKAREQMKKQWQDEEFRQMKSDKMREQNPNWKGGITPISDFLRSLPVVSQWFDDSKKQVNYTCELTGKVGVKLHTHHLYAFNMIVLEGHKLHNIEIKKQVKDYTKEELHKLEQYVESFHKDTSNAIVLCEQVHNLFHSLYGKGENTPEQFEEFKERYLNGEFKEIFKIGVE